MGYPIGNHLHTLAQLARRAGISEGRARAHYSSTPSKLPKPDRTDADGKPLWFAATIDRWCARTGRAVADDSLWIFRAPAATEPAVELRREVVTVYPRGTERTMFAIVWDTPRGHVIYLQPLGDTGGDHKDWMAVAAAELIEPRWWSSAIVVMPVESSLAFYLEFEPIAYIYKISSDADGGPDDEEDTGALGGIRRWLRRTAATPGPARPRAEWKTHLDLADIAKVLGRPIPFWLTDTTTVSTAEKSLAYTGTQTVPDTITEWPDTEKRLRAALDAGMPSDFPAAFAALAADARDGLRTLRAAHEKTPSTGEGWQLVARPAKPAPPLHLEQLITKTEPVTDLDLVATELTELRVLERDLDVDDPRGDAYEHAVQTLAWQLRAAEKKKPGRYTAVADDDLAVYSSPWDDGPVIASWRENLTRTDLQEARRLRRVRRLLEGGYDDHAREAFRDVDGRYVIVVRLDNGETWFKAEWPVALDVVATWTDETILAGDDTASTTTLLALTTTPDGRMRTDPVPLPRPGGRDAFGFGYSGGGPSFTYTALLRAALGVGSNETSAIAKATIAAADEDEPTSQLWSTISSTSGPLRLSWPQVKLWARADRKRANTDERA
ncbi:hypothetical protein ACFQ68_13125 [Amycolatopsis japonica]|uniref:hypothetical protein n=1 Tax=Amycolatopsis japonica TaxID=208439 RepID=UPI003671EE56